jgi:hypothetical protein
MQFFFGKGTTPADVRVRLLLMSWDDSCKSKAMTLVDVRVRLKKQVTKKIFKPKTTQKEIAKRFRVKSSFSAFKPSVKSVQEKVGGYRREEKTRFASSGLFSLLCSATSGAGILKTQVFKNPRKRYFSKKISAKSSQKGICVTKKSSAETLCKKRILNPFKKIQSIALKTKMQVFKNPCKRNFVTKEKNTFKKN